jgi:hypothetical protein
MDSAWCGIVMEPLAAAVKAEKPDGVAQTEGVPVDGSSIEISML